jgi:hypothetical protein
MYTVIICNREGWRIETVPTQDKTRMLENECNRNPRNVSCTIYGPNGQIVFHGIKAVT